ncbi:MAG: energy transducer TonB [Betaproteobacteria bacterium]|nr:energy transducer TonB [Betaproteobacteria bacterium]
MERGKFQGEARQRWEGALVVVLLHVALFYALVSGLRPHPTQTPTRAFEVSLLPELALPKPRPPAVVRPSPPQPEALPQAPAAPPQAPPPQAVTLPAAPASPAPPTPVAAAAPRPHVKSGVNPIYIPPLEELQRRYPREARREGLSGRVVVRLTVSPNGDVVNAAVRQSTPPGLFDALALDFVRRFRFERGSEEFLVDQELVFKLNP